jgi:site-specific DNA recombinase
MLLSILAAVAQEESHSISENMKWGMRKRFQAGKPKWTLTYGFMKDENGEYQIERFFNIDGLGDDE